MKKNIEDLVKGAKGLSGQAKRIGEEAFKTASVAKEAAQTGVNASKVAFQKASKLINRKKIVQTLEVTSKGLDLASKGIGMASKAVLDASQKIKSKS